MAASMVVVAPAGMAARSTLTPDTFGLTGSSRQTRYTTRGISTSLCTVKRKMVMSTICFGSVSLRIMPIISMVRGVLHRPML